MRWVVTVVLAFAAACSACAAEPKSPQNDKTTRTSGHGSKPVNFVFVLVDDLGWSDVSYNGSRFYRTPQIDRLASQGMVFTSGYAPAPLCSASRASILSGQYPARNHLTSAIVHFADGRFYKDPIHPWHKWIAGEEAECLPLEKHTLAERLSEAGYATAHVGKWHLGQPSYRPEKQGFALNVGGSFYPAPRSYFSPYRMGDVIRDGPDGEYLTDRLTDEAIQFLRDNKDRPFYLQLWHYAVHTPIQAKTALEQKYLAKVEPGAPHRNPTYAAMIESTDESVGRLMHVLEELDLVESTVVVLTSDNGGLLTLPNTGTHITSNVPLRGGKAMLWEGGIRVPFVVRWPGVTAPGSTCDVPVSGMDLYPTLAEIAGAEVDSDQPVDGESLVPLLRQTGNLSRKTLFWHFPRYIPVFRGYDVTPASAVRIGNYKLIKSFETGAELYDLRNDIGEANNLADEMPRRAAEMEAILEDWYRQVDANLPTPNPNYDPTAKPTGEILDFDPARATLLRQWAFDDGVDRWRAAHDCRIAAESGCLAVTCTGGDPFAVVPVSADAGSTIVTLRYRAHAAGFGQLFWTTTSERHHHRTRSHRFQLVHGDGQWRQTAIHIHSPEPITGLRLDPGSGVGTVQFDWIRLYSSSPRQ